MEGDSWETEDHRNWTDASFKTYSRPLALPYPYKVAARAEETRHTATLTFAGKLPAKAPPGARRRRVRSARRAAGSDAERGPERAAGGRQGSAGACAPRVKVGGRST